VWADPVYQGTLTNLHNSGWWTGTIIHAPARIKLTSKWHSFEWEQHNLFHPFPFPFPSWMAKDIDLQITVTSLSGTKMKVMLYFHDLEAIKKDRYVFVDKGPVFHWNGYTADPSKLKARTLHTVPLMPKTQSSNGLLMMVLPTEATDQIFLPEATWNLHLFSETILNIEQKCAKTSSLALIHSLSHHLAP
jgi:hypothetical protein